MSWLALVSLLLLSWIPIGGLLRLPVFLRVPLIIIWIGCALWTGYIFIIKLLLKHTSLEQMAFKIEKSYPGVQLITAHVGRAYCREDVGNAFDVLSNTDRMRFDFAAKTND